MKLSRFVFTATALFSAVTVANAGVNLSHVVGYHHAGKAWDEQREELGYAKKNGIAKGLAVGLEMTPTVSAEVEYLNLDNDARRAGNATPRNDFNQENLSLNFLFGLNSDYSNPFKPYILLGLGNAKHEVFSKADGSTQLDDTKHLITNLGLGAKYRFGDVVALKSELRGIYNTKGKWVEGLATLGLQATIGGHLGKPKPVVAQVIEPKPIPVKVLLAKQPTDSDEDGVADAADRCPNTKRGTKVDATGCAIPLKMELRVFFDKNKSVIKSQYRPEIAKVANEMRKNTSTTATIEGHTSNTGSRRLNERLSLARANAVKGMLANQYSINPARMSTKGYAWDRPIAPNNNAEGRALNRRVYAIIK